MEEGKENYFSYFICFGIGVLLGCLFLNLFWKWNTYVVIQERQYAMKLLAEDESYLRFWKIATGVIACFMYFFLVGFGFTSHGIVFFRLLSFLSGVWTGSFLTECILYGGAAFLGLLMQRILPEWVFYIMSVLFCLIWQNNMSTGHVSGRSGRGKRSGLKHWKNLLISVFFFCLWAGSLIYVNLIY